LSKVLKRILASMKTLITAVRHLGIIDDFCLCCLVAKLEDSIGIRLADEVALGQLGGLHEVNTEHAVSSLGLDHRGRRLGGWYKAAI
jgi:hypothetical protein